MLKASVIGNLGADPDMKYLPSGSPMLQMNVASNYRVKSQAGNWTDATEWVRVTVFGKRAETLSGMLKKGMRVFVDGRLEARPWTSRDGTLHAGLELVASDVEFFSQRNDDSQPARQRPAGDDDGDLESIPF
jgi:single-strand DNA-binding protein